MKANTAMPTWESELQKMWQPDKAERPAGEQNSKWWLTPTNKYYERSEYDWGVLGGRCNHDWGVTERGEKNKLTRHEEHLLERMSECGSVSHKGSQKNTTWKVEIFLWLLVLPLGLCFCELSKRMTKTYLPGQLSGWIACIWQIGNLTHNKFNFKHLQ